MRNPPSIVPIVVPPWLLVAASTACGQFAPQTTTMWAPYLEWRVENPSFDGNPFDLQASVTFVHEESGEHRTTGMFYDGGSVWKFRFTGMRTGTWRFATESSDPELDALEGTVTVLPQPDSEITGFLISSQGKFAVQTGDEGTLRGTILQVYWGAERLFSPSFDGLPADVREYGNAEYVEAMVRHLLDRGCNALAINVNNQWFKAGADSYDQHNSENPDLETFRALETAIVTAHRLGARIHFWLWGDEQRGWTPIGVGGINGPADRRLQRYIAARLGPLPGWTMAYGFDLEEWVNETQLRDWAGFMHQHLGWPHLLMARSFSNAELDVLSNDNRPVANFYQDAVRTVQRDPKRPHFYERRFLYTRDNWDMENTLTAFWEFAMAGGVGSSWGIYYWADQAPDYPQPELLRTHATFWRQRLLLDLAPVNQPSDGFVLQDSHNTNFVFFKKNTSSIRLDLSQMSGEQPAIAVDARKAYEELALGTLPRGTHTWQAPYRSDWAIAVGRFAPPSGETGERDRTPPVPPGGLRVRVISDIDNFRTVPKQNERSKR